MTRFAVLSFALVLGAPVFAQTRYSPDPGFQSSMGNGYAYYLGAYPQGRFQLADGNLRNAATVITKISYRFDNRLHTTTAAGRSFTNVSLSLSDCDLARMTTTLSTNATSTPSLAFSGSVTWPTVTGMPAPTWDISFPCNVFVTNPTTDLLADYQFSGGTLANGVVWATSSARTYYLDGYFVGSYGSSTANNHFSGKTCLDSKTPDPRTNPYTYQYLYAYGPTYATVSYRNMFRYYMRTYYTAPNATVLHALDAFGSAAGTTLPGVACANLHVAGSPVMLLMPQATDATGHSPTNYLGATNGLIPFNAAAVGLTLWAQGAWADSTTGGLKLTMGSSIVVPSLPKYLQNADANRSCALMAYPGATAYKYEYFYYNPITKYN